MKHAHTPRRRQVLGALYAAALLSVALRPLPALVRSGEIWPSAPRDGRSFAAAVAAMRKAEDDARRVVPVVADTDATSESLRSRLAGPLHAVGAELRSVVATEHRPDAAGLVRRRMALRVNCPSPAIGDVLARIRTAIPNLIVEHITLDGTATTSTSPDPQLVVEGLLWTAGGDGKAEP